MIHKDTCFDLVAYVSTMVTLTAHGKYYSGACPMCGGRDRFTIKRTTRDVWICRKCADGKYHSVIDFIMAYHKIDLQEAQQRMCGDFQYTYHVPSRPNPAVALSTYAMPLGDWQS